MSAVSLWALESLAYHEGVPGHHMQIAIQNELTDIPVFRTQYGYSALLPKAGGSMPRISARRWACSPTRTTISAGSTSELWRAVRLVLDTGLHAKGWTEDEAVAWAMANSARPESSIKSEVKRFLLWPGAGDDLQDRHDQDPASCATRRRRSWATSSTGRRSTTR